MLIKDGKIQLVRWICQYISAGETDANLPVKINTLSISDLCKLFEHAKQFKYESLMKKVKNTVMLRVHQGLPSKFDIKGLYEYLPEFIPRAIARVVEVLLTPTTMDYAPYVQLASEHPAFNADVNVAVEAILGQLIKRGQIYYTQIEKAAAKKAALEATKCYACKGFGHLARDCSTPQACYNCKKPGHIAGDCPANANRNNYKQGFKRHPKMVDVSGNGGGLRTCTREVRSGEYTRTGLKI